MTLDFSAIPILDHHSHSLLRNPPANVGDWLHFFTESADPDLISRHVPHTLFFQFAVKALALFLACEPTPEAVLAERNKMDQPGWAKRLIQDANITGMLIDYGFQNKGNYTHDELKEILPCHIAPILRLETLAQELIFQSDTLAQFRDSYRAEIEAVKNAGYVALKSIIAYRTGLKIRQWPRSEVEDAFARSKESARREGHIRLADQPLNDTLVLDALEIAERQQLPFQFHTGYGDADVDMQAANPLNFRSLLQSGKYVHVPWVLLHQSYPYVREAGYLASIYANVYADLSLAIPFAVSETDSLLIQLLGLAPTTKLLFASDGFSVPELFWLGAKVGRTGLERVLSLQVDNGILSVDEAYKTAAQILFENSEKLYRL